MSGIEGTGGAISRASTATFGSTILRVVVLSVVLALLLEVLLVALAIFSGTFEGLAPFLVDALQKIAWSGLLCTGLALGLLVSRAHTLVMALVGLLAAPVASLTAHSVVEAAHALAVGGVAAAGPSPFVIATIKGAEYAYLGLAAGWLGGRVWAGLHHHALAGLLAGLLFGGLVLATSAWPAIPVVSALALLRWAVNELLFPVGCAVILFLTGETAIDESKA